MNLNLEMFRKFFMLVGSALFIILMYFILSDSYITSQVKYLNPATIRVSAISGLTGIVCMITLFAVIHSDRMSVYARGCLQLFLFVLFIYLICFFPQIFIEVALYE